MKTPKHSLTHIIFKDLVAGREPRVVDLWESRTCWTALALAHVRKLFRVGVRPGAHGINQADYRVVARFRNRTEADVSSEFVANGWAKWVDYDQKVRPEDVPGDQPARRHRAELYWSPPAAEPDASHAAACAFAAAARAERAEMATAAVATAPDALAAAVESAVPVEPEAYVGVDTVAKANASMLENMLAAVASMPQPEPRPLPTPLPAAAEPDLLPAVVAAVHSCLRVLAGAGDLGRDRAFIWVQAGKQELTPAQARACCKILDRHRGLLPVNLVALAMGKVDPDPVPDAAPEPVSAAEPATIKAPRGRGRPPKNTVAMTAAERNKAWLSGKGLVSLEVPGHLADRLRTMRGRQGTSTADLLAAALGALEREQAVRMSLRTHGRTLVGAGCLANYALQLLTKKTQCPLACWSLNIALAAA